MGIFPKGRFVFTAICLAAFIYTGTCQATDENVQKRMPYTKTRAAKIESNGKKGVAAFGSVIHALHGIDHFKHHYKQGEKNGTKKKLQSLFYKLGHKKSIKASIARQYAKFFEKSAKKMNIRNNIFLSTQFFLEKCGMPSLSQSAKITLRPVNSAQNSGPITFFLTRDQLRIFILPARTRSKSTTISQLLTEKRKITSLYEYGIEDSLKKLTLFLPEEIKEEIKKLPSNKFNCEIEFFMRIKDEKTIPKILPIYLDRIYKKSPNLPLVITKKNITPSRKLEIPIENDPSRVAQYVLVSMIAEKLKSYQGDLFCYPYACVLTKQKKRVSWAFYDQLKVRLFKNPKRHSKIKISPIMKINNLHKDLSRTGNLFFYRYAGCKTVPLATSKREELAF